MTITFIDAGVLIAAALGIAEVSAQATEKPDKPLYRTTDIRVRSIHT